MAGNVGTVQSIVQLQSFAGQQRTLIVTDPLRGGTFNFTLDEVTPDGGIIFEAEGIEEGYWVREITQAKGWNVQWWGATGDGVTDDTAAIQAAVDNIPVSGGSLYFPAGVYVCSETINVPNQTFFIGDGAPSYQFGVGGVLPLWGSIIAFDNSTDDLIFCETTASFSDIGFYNVSETTPTNGHGINLDHAGSFSMVNTVIVGFYDNLKIHKGTKWTITNSNFWYHIHWGVHIINPNTVPAWTDTGDQSIHGGSISGNRNGTEAIYFESSGGLKIVNVKIGNGALTRGLNGIHANIIAPGTSILEVSNCSIEGFTGSGILVERQEGAQFGQIIIDGNQFFPAHTGITGNAVQINNAIGVSVIGNIFNDDGTNTAHAVKFTSVVNGTVYPNTYSGWTNKVSLTTCTNVISEPDFLPTNGSLNLVSSTGTHNAIANVDALAVHKAGTETITGSKTTSGNWTNSGVWLFDSPNFITLKRTTVATTGIQGALVINLESSGTPADGFGPRMPFQIQGNQIGALAAVRDGANNSGKLVFQTYNAGVLGEYLTLDKAGKAVFSGTIEVPTPTLATQATRKDYVDPSNNTSSAGTLALAATNKNMFYVFTGTTSTWTLPAVSGNTGTVIHIINKGSGTITLNSNAGGNDIWDSGVTSSTKNIPSGQQMRLYNDGTNWDIIIL